MPRSRAERQGVCGWWFLTLKVLGSVVCSCVQPKRGRLGLCLRHEVSGTHPPQKMPPREGGEILSWPSGSCSGTAVRNREAAGDPARDQLKGEEAWRTRLPDLPQQPLRCNLPAFGLRHHHHHFPGPGQCLWRCSARLRTECVPRRNRLCRSEPEVYGVRVRRGAWAGARVCADQTVEAIARSVASRRRNGQEGSF